MAAGVLAEECEAAQREGMERVHPEGASDRKAFEALLAKASDAELVKPFAWGNGQSPLRQALLIADHAAYHTGELIVLRRLLGAWKS